MPIQWHHANNPVIASNVQPPTPNGGIRVPFQGPGSYLFYVDHRPHDNRLLAEFVGNPRVVACAPNGRPLGPMQIHPDRFRDRNAIMWDVRQGTGTGYYAVQYQLSPRSIQQCARGTGFTAFVKYARPTR